MGTASLRGTDSVNAVWPPAPYGEQSCSWDVARQSPKSPQQSPAPARAGVVLSFCSPSPLGTHMPGASPSRTAAGRSAAASSLPGAFREAFAILGRSALLLPARRAFTTRPRGDLWFRRVQVRLKLSDLLCSWQSGAVLSVLGQAFPLQRGRCGAGTPTLSSQRVRTSWGAATAGARCWLGCCGHTGSGAGYGC